jgi:hypothetical protein
MYWHRMEPACLPIRAAIKYAFARELEAAIHARFELQGRDQRRGLNTIVPLMWKHHLLYAGLLTAAIGIPYTAAEWKGLVSWALQSSEPAQPAGSAEFTSNGNFPGDARSLGQAANSASPPAEHNTVNANPWSTSNAQRTAAWPVGYNANSDERTSEDSNAYSYRAETERSTAGDLTHREQNQARRDWNTKPLPSLAEPPSGLTLHELGLASLDEVFRFDVTTGWIMQKWPRVNTAIGDQELRGFRVPLITGAGEQDLAGALTYYFNKQHSCQRIAFSGTVGDPRPLVQHLTEKYGFEPIQSDIPGEHAYHIRWNGRARSELRLRPAEIVRANSPHLRYHVELLMNLK